MERTAIIEGNYRYELGRVWNHRLPFVGFIMHNSSFADDKVDDPTVRRCINFGRLWGYGGILVWNLSPYITKNPRDLERLTMQELLGDEKQAQRMFQMVENVPKVVCAWGEVKALIKLRALQVLRDLSSNRHKIYCLGVNKSGQPKHPLYIPSTFLPRLYTERPD